MAIEIHTQKEVTPKIYQPEDVQRILKIGKSKTYSFLGTVEKNGGPFPVIRVGNLYRIPKAAFDEWVSTGKSVM